MHQPALRSEAYSSPSFRLEGVRKVPWWFRQVFPKSMPEMGHMQFVLFVLDANSTPDFFHHIPQPFKECTNMPHPSPLLNYFISLSKTSQQRSLSFLSSLLFFEKILLLLSLRFLFQTQSSTICQQSGGHHMFCQVCTNFSREGGICRKAHWFEVRLGKLRNCQVNSSAEESPAKWHGDL